MAAHLVIIPAPGVGHIFAAVEFAQILVERDCHLSITILLMTFPNSINTRSIASSGSHDRITYVHLSHDGFATDPTKPPWTGLPSLIEYHKPEIRDFLAEPTRPESTRLAGILIDMFCAPLMDLADQINVPSYILSTSGAGFLCLAFHALAQDLSQFKDSEAELTIPGFVSSVPAKVLPCEFTGGDWSELFLTWVAKCKKSKGIIVNTFAKLQFHAVTYLSDNGAIPPVFPVGPILKLEGVESDNNHATKFVKKKKNHATKSDAIMSWLDHQPKASVVFLCFGSMGTFDAEQVIEIAHALAISGTRFLWSLRRPIPKGHPVTPEEYEDFAEVLPKGFLEKTAKIGKVIGWAPQTAVLSHPSTSGFVSHCGWNSCLESIWFGVPIATWPHGAEQQSNAFKLVRETGIAVELKPDYKKNFGAEANYLVTTEEIEKAINQLKEVSNSDDNLIKHKVNDMNNKCRMAVAKGGSSSVYIDRFIEGVIGDKNLKF